MKARRGIETTSGSREKEMEILSRFFSLRCPQKRAEHERIQTRRGGREKEERIALEKRERPQNYKLLRFSLSEGSNSARD